MSSHVDTDLPDAGALEGIRVVELTHAIAGPHCGQILADHGADVIKIEPPTGDVSRASRPLIDDDSVYFACHNRGKRSVALDLKTDTGRTVLDRLVSDADVILTNYTADVPRKLGFDYETVRKVNPGVVVVHITGFGQASPDRNVRAYDGIIQSMSGIPAATGTPESGPTLVAAFVADHIAAYQAALGALFALRDRDRTGRGAFVDVSMLDGYAATSAHFLQAALSGVMPPPVGNRVPTAFANTFKAADGGVYLSPLGQEKWRVFCQVIGRHDWATELDYFDMLAEHRDAAEAEVSAWCAHRTQHQIVTTMKEAAIPCGPVMSSLEYARRAVSENKTEIVTAPGGSRFAVPGVIGAAGIASYPRRTQVPGLGEHTQEVLSELGLDNAGEGLRPPAGDIPTGLR